MHQISEIAADTSLADEARTDAPGAPDPNGCATGDPEGERVQPPAPGCGRGRRRAPAPDPHLMDSAALNAFRITLAMIPAAWVLWVLDGDERYVVLEGSGLERIGVVPVQRLGRTLAEAHPDHPEVVAWGRRYMRGAGTDLAVIRGETLLLSGAPTLDGGCIGIGILLEAGSPARAGEPGQVVELSRDLPGAGARRGDLLVVDVARPGKVGLYREIDVALLGWELQQELRKISPSFCAGGPQVSPRSSGERSQARVAHLRLLP